MGVHYRHEAAEGHPSGKALDVAQRAAALSTVPERVNPVVTELWSDWSDENNDKTIIHGGVCGQSGSLTVDGGRNVPLYTDVFSDLRQNSSSLLRSA